jgi:hypothetical protein
MNVQRRREVPEKERRDFFAAFMTAMLRTRITLGAKRRSRRPWAHTLVQHKQAESRDDRFWNQFAAAMRAQRRSCDFDVGNGSVASPAGRRSQARCARPQGGHPWKLGLGSWLDAVSTAEAAGKSATAAADKLRSIGEALGILEPVQPPARAKRKARA